MNGRSYRYEYMMKKIRKIYIIASIIFILVTLSTVGAAVNKVFFILASASYIIFIWVHYIYLEIQIFKRENTIVHDSIIKKYDNILGYYHRDLVKEYDIVNIRYFLAKSNWNIVRISIFYIFIKVGKNETVIYTPSDYLAWKMYIHHIYKHYKDSSILE